MKVNKEIASKFSHVRVFIVDNDPKSAMRYEVSNIQAVSEDQQSVKIGGDWYPVMEWVSRPEQAFIVLSIGQMEQMLKAARRDARLSTAHPGKAPKHFCRVIYANLLGPEHNGTEGERHIQNVSFMDSACRVVE